MPAILEVNYLAVLVCGIISMIIGFVWYSHILLGRIWMEEIDKSEDELKKDFNPVKTYGISFLCNLFIAFSLAQLMAHSNAVSVASGIRMAFLCWSGFILAPMIINAMLEGKSIKLLLVDSGHHLIVILVFGIILGAWTI
ncbi:MAG: DUF1761 domain-containing protein [Melioribacteraceae bacterium]